MSLSDTQNKIIQIVQENPHTTALELQQALDLSETDFYNEVRELKQAGILSHVGLANAGTWVLKNRSE